MRQFFCTVEMNNRDFYSTVIVADDIRTANRNFLHDIKRHYRVEEISRIEVCTKTFIDRQVAAFTRDPSVYMD